ncbi:MAG: sensor histidine kinase [Clostridia bacterium]|nr:sensor histidine kinase [Clostridia bacterium]
MDRKVKLNFKDQKFAKYIKIVLIAILVIIEIIICAQHVGKRGGIPFIIYIVVCCVLLAVFEALNSFVIKKYAAKLTFYALDSVLLLAICLLTGNSYLSTLYCIVLTQFYLTFDEGKINTILFIVSCGLFVISFVCGWVVINKGASLYESIVQIFGDCVFGIFILGTHFAIINFLLKFYSNNVKLSVALKEADESKARLEAAYEKISQTAVYEERNRIAKDIHDNAGHSMTTVIMQTEAAKLLIDNNPEEAKNRIISANIQAKNALEQMRESVHLLAGRAHAKTLRAEFEEIIAQTIDGTELKIRCDLEDLQADEEEHRFLCNTLKECLANGIRHGKATTFYIELKNVLSCISLLISDNGCGVQGEINEGFGLKGIREKTEKLGGRCYFSSEDGEGFEVTITLPYQKNKELL